MGEESRPRIRRLTVAGVTAITVFVALYLPEREDGSGAFLGSAFALVAVALGLAGVAGVRPLPRRRAREHMRVLAVSVAIGITLGSFNLAANYGIASLDPAIHAAMTKQWSDFSAWSVLFAGVVMEEIGYRLLLMGGTAWLISRLTQDRQRAFVSALAISSLVFGLAHVLPGSRPTSGMVHAIAVTLKSGVAGLLLGWVFWRKGLPYAMVCHSTANAVHMVAWPWAF